MLISDLPIPEVVTALVATGKWQRDDWDIRVWGRDGNVMVRRAYRDHDVAGYAHEDPTRVAEHRRQHVRLARDLVAQLQALAPGSALIEGAGVVAS